MSVVAKFFGFLGPEGSVGPSHQSHKLTTAAFTAATATAAAAAAAAAFLTRDYQRRLRNFRSKAAKGRLLGQSEAEFHLRRHHGVDIDSNIVFIDSVRPIDAALVSAAAARVAARHPMLRSIVKSVAEEDGSESLYLEEVGTFRPQIRLFSTSDWNAAFVQDVHEPFDHSNGPLWRLTLLPSTKDDDKYVNVILATFFHVIIDGRSIMSFVDELMEALTEISAVEETGVELPEVRPLRHSPSISQSLPEKLVNLPFLTRMFTFTRLKLFGSLPVKPLVNCALMEATKSERSKLRSPGTTRLIPIQLCEEEVEKLLQLCRSFDCKMHGALDAAFHLALSATIAELDPKTKEHPLEIRSFYNVNANNLIERNEKEEFYGARSSASQRKKLLSIDDRKEENFWRLAKEFHDEIHEGLRRRPYSLQRSFLVFVYRFFPAFHDRWISRPADKVNDEVTAIYDYAISSRGSYSFKTPMTKPFRVTKMFYGVNHVGQGRAIYNYMVTINGRLFWSLIYYDDYVTKETAEKCAAHLRRILKRVVQ